METVKYHTMVLGHYFYLCYPFTRYIPMIQEVLSFQPFFPSDGPIFLSPIRRGFCYTILVISEEASERGDIYKEATTMSTNFDPSQHKVVVPCWKHQAYSMLCNTFQDYCTMPIDVDFHGLRCCSRKTRTVCHVFDTRSDDNFNKFRPFSAQGCCSMLKIFSIAHSMIGAPIDIDFHVLIIEGRREQCVERLTPEAMTISISFVTYRHKAVVLCRKYLWCDQNCRGIWAGPLFYSLLAQGIEG